MGLPNIQLTDGQKKVMGSLITAANKAEANVDSQQQRLDEAKAVLAAHVDSINEYTLQASEKLGISTTDYILDAATGSFKDRSTIVDGIPQK